MKSQKSHPNWWRVYEGDILRANQSTEAGAMNYMEPGRVLVPPSTGGPETGYHPGSLADPRD